MTPENPTAEEWAAIVEEAQSATTPGARLAELAQSYPTLRATIAANPSAYDALISWLAAQGDPEVAGVIATRRAADPTVPLDGVPVFGPTDDAQPRRRRRGRTLVVVLASAVVGLLLIGGGTAVALRSVLTGEFSGPIDSARAFPVGTYAVQEFSIDPSAGQKVAALEMLASVPQLRQLIQDQSKDVDLSKADESTDVRKAIWDQVVKAQGGPDPLDYDTDIAPWIGSRLAVGTFASGSDATSTEFAVQASDTGKAVTALRKAVTAWGIHEQVVAHDGYAIILDADVDAAHLFDHGSVADSASLTSAAAAMGEWGLASGWYSPRAALEAQAASGSITGSALDELRGLLPENGSISSITRVTDRSLETISRAGGLALPALSSAGSVASSLEALPASTALAVSVHGLGTTVDHAWSAKFGALFVPVAASSSAGITGGFADAIAATRAEALGSFEQTTGLSVPDGLSTAFGDTTTFAMDTDLGCGSASPLECSDPALGLRIDTTNPSDTDAALQKLLDRLDPDGYLDHFGITTHTGTNVVTVAKGSYGSTLAKPGSTLGSGSGLTRALPDLDHAIAAIYLNGDALTSIAKNLTATTGSEPPADLDLLKGVAVAGITLSQDSTGDLTVRTRITTEQ